MNAANSFVIESNEPEEMVRVSAWHPSWTVNCGDDCTVGLAVDDGCFIVLYPTETGWRPGKHIPKAAAEQFARLLHEGVLN